MAVAKKVATPKPIPKPKGKLVKVTKEKGKFIAHYEDGSTGVMSKEDYFK